MQKQVIAVLCAATVLVALPKTSGAAPEPTMAHATALGGGIAVSPDAELQTGPRDELDDAVPGELAIDFRDDVRPADMAALAAKYGLTLRPNSAWSASHDKLDVAEVDPAREATLLERIAGEATVEHAEPMTLYRATFVPNDPLYTAKQWHLTRVGAERAWDYTCGEGVTVAVVDTGIACFDTGPFSRGTDLLGTRCRGGWNFVEDGAAAYDDQGHGTHVAGTIAQTTNNGFGTAGLAYCATLMPVKVLNRQGFGTVANVAEGIRFAADEGAQIINLSLGGPIRSAILGDAVAHALAKGVVVVAAAGNSGRSVGFPAAYPGVVAVSATDASDTIAWFSSRGPEVSIAAPGVGVTQQTICNGGRDQCETFGTFNGTSMASPHVAGIAAMIESLGVTRAEAVRNALFRSADSKQDKDLYGAGIVDAGAAAAMVFWTRFATRAAVLVGLGWLVARQIRQRGGKIRLSVGAWIGALWAATGLLPLGPWFGLASGLGHWSLAAELAMRPLAEWDLVLLGAGAHQWLLLGSAIPAIVLSSLGFASARLRPFIGGVALGSAAWLIQMAWFSDVAFVGGPFLALVWALGNAVVCVWIARIGLESRG